MYYADVFNALNEARARYLVAGGMAVNLHGVPRLTQDLDLLIELSQDNIHAIVGALTALGYVPTIPVDPMDFGNQSIREQWIREKHMKVFSMHHKQLPFQVIDLMCDVPVSYEDSSQRKVVQHAGALEIPLVSIPDLICMKEVAGRKTDLSDIRMLREIQRLEAQHG